MTCRGASGLTTTPATTCRAANVAFVKRSRLSPTSPMTTGCTGIGWHQCHSAGIRSSRRRVRDACWGRTSSERPPARDQTPSRSHIPVTGRSGACGRRLLISGKPVAHQALSMLDRPGFSVNNWWTEPRRNAEKSGTDPSGLNRSFGAICRGKSGPPGDSAHACHAEARGFESLQPLRCASESGSSDSLAVAREEQ